MIIGVRKMRPRVVLLQPPVTGTKMRSRYKTCSHGFRAGMDFDVLGLINSLD